MAFLLIQRAINAIRRANYRRIRARRAPARLAYQQAIQDKAAQSDLMYRGYHQRYQALPHRPLISIVMPVYNAHTPWLQSAIESVRSQIYQEWELCIADDASTRQEVHAYLHDIVKADSRIKVIFRPSNGHISAASNSALDMANGDYVALMDQDDLIPPQALLRVTEALRDCPEAKLVYSDEDIIWLDGLRESPSNKGPWAPQKLLTTNYVCHLGIYSRALLKSIGGFRTGFEGAQDHDLILRCSEQLRNDEVVYIPEVLYHWRAHEGSTSTGDGAKPYVKAARNKSIQSHLSRVQANQKRLK
jgi:glycosyltransferase involved in cell wall biosynthesis